MLQLSPLNLFLQLHVQFGWNPETAFALPLQLAAFVQAGAQIGNGPKPGRQRSQSVAALTPAGQVSHCSPRHWWRHWQLHAPGSPVTPSACDEQSVMTSQTRVVQLAPA